MTALTGKQVDNGDHNAKVREVFDRTRMGITVGEWRGKPVDAVELVGLVRDLHGSVCTCCPRRSPERPVTTGSTVAA